MLEMHCPWCEYTVQAPTPPMVMITLAVHFAEQANDPSHRWPTDGTAIGLDIERSGDNLGHYRAKISLAFLQQATNALQRSGLLSWPEGELNVTDRILATMRSAEADLADMIVYAEQHSKTNVRT